MHSEEQPADRAYWEDRYAGAELAWSGNPNPVLVSEASELPPGRALDIGCGEGADALWLAQHGWRVTGVDIATNALNRARMRAETADTAAAALIDWEQHDITAWSPNPESYELVSSQFMQMLEPTRSALFRSLARALAPGGTLLIVGHDPTDFGHDSQHRAHLREKMFSVDDVLAAIKDEGLHVAVAESRERLTSLGASSDFHRDVVVLARRTRAEE